MYNKSGVAGTMDIGSSAWMQSIDNISQQMGEHLSLEGTVVAQRASELQAEAQKVQLCVNRKESSRRYHLYCVSSCGLYISRVHASNNDYKAAATSPRSSLPASACSAARFFERRTKPGSHVSLPGHSLRPNKARIIAD